MATGGSRSSTSEPRVTLGRVVGVHGVRGELRVQVLGDGPENLLAAPWLELAMGAAEPGGPDARAGASGQAAADPAPGTAPTPSFELPVEFRVRYPVAHAAPGRPGEVRIALDGVDDREAAETLRGRYVLGSRQHLAPLAEGEHYWFELIGCRVEAADGAAIGTVRELWDAGAHDLLVVDGVDGRQQLLPAARRFLVEVDVARGRIVYDLIPGMLDDPA